MNRQDLILLCTALIALPVSRTSAQKIPLEGDSRIVQIHDVSDLVRGSWPAPRPGVDPMPSPAEVEERERRALEGMADFARTFMQPPLDGENDIQPLGRKYLVALARPEQQSWLENLIRRQREAGDHHLFLQVWQFKLLDAQYEKVFQPLLRRIGANPEAVHRPGSEIPLVSFLLDAEKTRTLAVLSKEDADGLMLEIAQAGNIDQVHAPTLSTRPMSPASMSFLRQTEYVKDFEQVVDFAGETTRIPVHDKIEDGIKVAVFSGLVGRNLVGLVLSVEVLELEEPIPTFDAEIEDGLTVTIELPSVDRHAVDQKLILTNGGTGLFAVRRESGTHIVFLATITTRN